MVNFIHTWQGKNKKSSEQTSELFLFESQNFKTSKVYMRF
jgi:hypothetical protein